ncbi:MAG: SHOCT domain-containing protein [Flavobacterium sp.]
MKNNLILYVSESIDTSYTISFERENPEKHGWEFVDKNFKEAFAYVGFKLAVPSKSHHYTIIMDYDYGYLISAYKMQYSNLKGKIIDLENDSHPIGSFSYSGRYENPSISDTIAMRLHNIVRDQQTRPKIAQNAHLGRSKEEQLTELKNLLDKGLITKEDYETQKTKILND